MLKNKPARITIIAILASLLSYSIAQACSPSMPNILIKCSNLEASIVANTPNETIENLQAVVPNCDEDLAPVLNSFEQEIIKWLNYKNKRGAFLDRDLTFEPYSTNRNFELQKNKENLLSCRYQEFRQIGNWLIIFETSRSYCYEFWHTPSMCPSIIFSLGHFLFYLVANFSITALPYLVGFLIAGAAIIYMWWALLKNRSALKLWKIITLSFVMLIIELFLIVMPFWLFGQIIGWVSFFCILVLWCKYLKNNKYILKQKPG